MAQSWPWGNQRLDKKMVNFFESLLFFIGCVSYHFMFHQKKPLKIKKIEVLNSFSNLEKGW